MMESFQSLDPIIQAIIVIIVLGIIWGVLQAVLKIAIRLFACGCVVIILIGLFIAFMAYGGFSLVSA